MTGVAIEQMLELWCVELRRVKADLTSLFAHSSVGASAAAFLDGLLGPERRKTGWMRAEAAGDPGPWRQQAVLGRSHWDAEALRDTVREYALETLASPGAVLVIDETGFLKQGQSSCGVGRQYTGSAGKIANCQIGVFAAYVSNRGCAFIDRQLYLPQDWINKPERLAAAQVPDAIRFVTKPQMAAQMIERALAAGVPFAWVATDTIYGALAMRLRRAGKGYVLGAHATDQFNSWDKSPPVAGTAGGGHRRWRAPPVAGTAETIAKALPPETWTRLSAGDGTKGARLYDWAYVALADLEAEEYNEELTGLWTRGLLIRRSLSDGDLAFFSTWCPAGTPIEELVRVEGQRWAIEDAFETAKTELGLTHNETRSWHGWHRHVSLVMLAFAMMAVVRQRANSLTSPQKRNDEARLQRWYAGLSRKSAASPPASSSIR
jgi:SRSO17 transposase